MTVLIKGGERVVDALIPLDDTEPLPESGDVLVSLERWRHERAVLEARPGRIGVRLANHEAVSDLASGLGAIALVALEFPSFRDGRAYSQARALRDRYGFQGELRAIGDVGLEQLGFMLRAGFDAFELTSADPEHDYRVASEEFSLWYQPAADAREAIFERRHGRS